jgi:hypothetical protein
MRYARGRRCRRSPAGRGSGANPASQPPGQRGARVLQAPPPVAPAPRLVAPGPERRLRGLQPPQQPRVIGVRAPQRPSRPGSGRPRRAGVLEPGGDSLCHVPLPDVPAWHRAAGAGARGRRHAGGCGRRQRWGRGRQHQLGRLRVAGRLSQHEQAAGAPGGARVRAWVLKGGAAVLRSPEHLSAWAPCGRQRCSSPPPHSSVEKQLHG